MERRELHDTLKAGAKAKDPVAHELPEKSVLFWVHIEEWLKDAEAIGNIKHVEGIMSGSRCASSTPGIIPRRPCQSSRHFRAYSTLCTESPQWRLQALVTSRRDLDASKRSRDVAR